MVSPVRFPKVPICRAESAPDGELPVGTLDQNPPATELYAWAIIPNKGLTLEPKGRPIFSLEVDGVENVQPKASKVALLSPFGPNTLAIGVPAVSISPPVIFKVTW